MAQNHDKERLEQQIDDNLRKVFQRKVEEDVPDKFLDLLAKLKAQESGAKADDK